MSTTFDKLTAMQTDKTKTTPCPRCGSHYYVQVSPIGCTVTATGARPAIPASNTLYQCLCGFYIIPQSFKSTAIAGGEREKFLMSINAANSKLISIPLEEYNDLVTSVNHLIEIVNELTSSEENESNEVLKESKKSKKSKVETNE